MSVALGLVTPAVGASGDLQGKDFSDELMLAMLGDSAPSLHLSS